MVDALARYVNDFKYGKQVSDSIEIEKLIRDEGTVIDHELEVYRGQRAPEIRPEGWISASFEDDVSRFVGVKCCIFKLKLQPGTRILDVDQILEKYGKPNKYRGEQEILVLLDGDLSRPTRVDDLHEKDTYEVLFTPRRSTEQPSKTPEEILKELDISADELEFIESPSDLEVYGVPKDKQDAIFKLLKPSGGRRFTATRRRRRVRQSRVRGGRGPVRSSSSKTVKRVYAGSGGRSAHRGSRF
jgi:hypothetical protein